MSALTEKILRSIAERKIRPLPLWSVRLKNIAYWAGTLLLIALSSIVTAFALHAVFEIDWEAYSKAGFSWIDRVLASVPFLSAALLIISIAGSILLWHRTRRGYRYPALGLLGFFVLSSGLIGYWIESSSLDEPVESFFLGSFGHSERLRNSLRPSAEYQWSQPGKGLLGGSIIEVDAERILLLDPKETLWAIDYSKATVAPDVTLASKEDIKMIGEQRGPNEFHANEIEMWQRSHRKPMSTPVGPDQIRPPHREEDDQHQERAELEKERTDSGQPETNDE